ncbi:MAG: hypothetical protein ACPG80_03075, partial [Rickettsiales bacterium]
MARNSKTFADLLDKIREGRHNGNVRLADQFLDDDDALELAKAIKHNPEISHLTLTRNNFTDHGIRAIAEMAKEHPGLRYLNVNFNPFGDKGMEAIAEMAAINRNLVALYAAGSKTGDGGPYILAEGVVAGNSKNLLTCSPSADSGTDLCRRNREVIKRLRTTLQSKNFPHLQTTQLYDITNHISAIQMQNSKDITADIAALDAFTATLPLPTKETIASPEELVKPQPREGDDAEYSPLENPKLWQTFPALCKTLAEKGTPLTREMLESHTSRDGQSLWDMCIQHAPSPVLLEGLNASGIYLRKDELLQKEEGSGELKASPILNTFLEHGYARALFKDSNWQGASPTQMKVVYHALPEAVKKIIPHQQLAVTMSRYLKSQAKEA